MKATPYKDIEEANRIVNEIGVEMGYDRKTVINIDSPLLIDDDTLLLFLYFLNTLAPKPLFDENVHHILTSFIPNDIVESIKRLANDITGHELNKLSDDQLTNAVVYAGLVKTNGDVLVVLQTLII